MGNLAHETTEADLKAVFSRHGQVVSAKIMSGRRGRTKGFAYVEMADEASAMSAMQSLRGTEIKGRMMDIVSEERPARSRSARGRSSGGSRR